MFALAYLFNEMNIIYRVLIYLLFDYTAIAVCHNITLCTFEGSNGASPDTATLNACTFPLNGTWAIDNQQLSFQSTAQKTLISAVNICSVGLKDGTGSGGFQGLVTGNSFYQPLSFQPMTISNRMYAGVWMKHSFPINAGGNQYDWFTGYSANGAQFCNAKLVCLGGIRWVISMETPAAPTQNDIYTPYLSNFSMASNTWYWVTFCYNASSDATNMQVAVYSYVNGVLFQEELLQNTNPASAVDCTKIDFGIQTPGTDSGLIGVCGVQYDNFILGDTFPVLPQGDPPGLTQDFGACTLGKMSTQ